MKNPLEFSLLEIEILLRGDPDGPQSEYGVLLKYVHDRIRYLMDYEVQKDVAQVKERRTVPRKVADNLDLELYFDAEVVLVAL